MPDLAAVIAKIQDLQDQAAQDQLSAEKLRAMWAERRDNAAKEELYAQRSNMFYGASKAYAHALELLKEVDGA